MRSTAICVGEKNTSKDKDGLDVGPRDGLLGKRALTS